MANDLTQLARFIETRFNLEELRTLCLDLEVNYENLAGETLRGKARELVLQFRRERRLKELLTWLREARPEAFDSDGLGTIHDVAPFRTREQPIRGWVVGTLLGLVLLAVSLWTIRPIFGGPRAEPRHTSTSPATVKLVPTSLPAPIVAFTPTHAPASAAAHAPTPTTVSESTATETSKPTPVTPSFGLTVAVPDAFLNEFFAPGPGTAALVTVGDSLWVADDENSQIYKLGSSGNPTASFAVTPTGDIKGLAWDGQSLYLATGGYGYGDRNQVIQVDTTGTVLGVFSLPGPPTGLSWDPVESVLWTASEGFLLKLNTSGRLLQTVHVPVSRVDALAWAPDGLWAGLYGSDDWCRLSPAGDKLLVGDLPFQVRSSLAAMAWDERGYLWLAQRYDRKIYQVSLRPEEVPPAPTPVGKAELALPRPQLEPAPAADRAIVHITNNLEGTVSLSFGKEPAILLAPGERWSAELDQGIYTVFASANVPGSLAFSSEELLVRGYEHTWSLER